MARQGMDAIHAGKTFGSQTDATGRTWQYAYAPTGNVTLVTDLLGNVSRTDYDSFGQVTNTTGIVDTLFRYTARPSLATTGLYDYRARTYDPRVGQFLSEDPIAFTAGDPNLRRYVGNEPTRYTDPSGLRGEQAIPPRPPHPGEPPEVDDMMNSRRKAYFRRLRAYEEWEAKYGLKPCESASSSTPVLDSTQAALDAVGMVDQGPAGAAADLASAGIDLWRGDLFGAFLGLLAALPVVGTGVGVVRKSRAVARAGQPVGSALHTTDAAKDAHRAADAAAANGTKCVAATSVRPKVKTSLPARVTHELPAGQLRTPDEVKQSRNFFERNRDAAKRWYEQRTGKAWPDDATHYEHPRPLKDGGDPLFVEPGFGGPNARHMIPGPDGLTDFERWGRLGGRPPKQ